MSWMPIRPWLPLLTLAVREITSVSVTFILSATINPPPDLDIDIDIQNALHPDDGQPSNSIISEALAKGLSVKVNGSPWQRVFIRIDDSLDEAVIIIYGLMPGRQYDIDLGIVHTRHLRRQITTQDPDSEPSSPESTVATVNHAHTPSTSPPTSTFPSSSHPPTSMASSNNTTTINPPSSDPTATSSQPGQPNPPPFTLEDRLSQLSLTLSSLNTERDSLQSQIKTIRRESQKADSLLRSDIEALKRASEKATSSELRAKQKILALQEAVKRAQAGAKTTEEQLAEVENVLPELIKEQEKKEGECASLKKEAERMRKAREEKDDKDQKRLERLRTDLASLSHKLEKMTGKKEKIEGTVLPDLEEQLNQTRKELDSVEKEEELAIEELAEFTNVSASDYVSRRRANTGGSIGPGPIGSRPSRTSSTSETPWPSTRLRDPSSSPTASTDQPTRTSKGSAGYPYPPGLGVGLIGGTSLASPFEIPYSSHSLTRTTISMHQHSPSSPHSSSPTTSSSNSPIGPHHPPTTLFGQNAPSHPHSHSPPQIQQQQQKGVGVGVGLIQRPPGSGSSPGNGATVVTVGGSGGANLNRSKSGSSRH